MNATLPSHPGSSDLPDRPDEPQDDPRSPLLQTLTILLAWRKAVLGFAAGAVLVSVVYSLLVKPVYLSRATLLPKQEESGFGGLSDFIGGEIGSFVGGLTGSTSSTDVLMSILESRFVRDRVIDRLGLIQELGIKDKDPARARETAHYRLERMVDIDLTRRLSIVIEARAGKPELSAGIANAYFEELDRLNQEFSFTSARQTRRFVEQRLAETRDSLAAAQVRLEVFQTTHGMISLDEQAKAAVEVASRVQGELIGLEAQLEVQKKYSSGGFSRTRDLQYRIDALRNRLFDLAGSSPVDSTTASPLMLRFSEMPALGRMMADLLLEVKTQEAVFTLLTTQYYQSKIEEARDVPTIQVLDAADPPVFRHSPKRKKNVLVGLLLGLGVGALMAFALEYLDRSLKGASGRQLRSVFGPRLDRVQGWLIRLRT